jgi:ribosomal protein S6
MTNYELTIVMPGKYTPAKVKNTQASLTKIVKLLKGKLGKADNWGKIDLAYQIKDNDTGNFFQYQLELNGKSAAQLKDKLRLEEGVIRFLLIKKGTENRKTKRQKKK